MLMIAAADSHIDCASEKKGGAAQNRRAAREEPDDAPFRDTIFSDDEIEKVDPVKQPKQPRTARNTGNGLIHWTKKISDIVGNLYDGMEE